MLMSMKPIRWSPIPYPNGSHPVFIFSCSDADISIALIGLEPWSFVAGGSSFGCMVVMALISLFVFISF